KFHLPAGVRSRTICGRSSVRSVTCNVLSNTSGITSTPTLSPLAVTNGALPNAGSSAIARSSAETLPVRIESFRFPIVTCQNQEPEVLRFLLELRILQASAVKLFLAFAALLVHHARSGFHLRLGFLRSPQFLQELSAQIMDTRTGLIELACGLNLRQRLFELA